MLKLHFEQMYRIAFIKIEKPWTIVLGAKYNQSHS